MLDPRVELELRRSLQDKNLVLDPTRLEKVIGRLSTEWQKASARGQEVALLTDASLRRPLRQALVRALPDLSIIAYQEIPTDLQLHTEALVKLEDLGATRPEVVAGSPRPEQQPGMNPAINPGTRRVPAAVGARRTLMIRILTVEEARMERLVREEKEYGQVVLPGRTVRLSDDPVRVAVPRHAGGHESARRSRAQGDVVQAIDVICPCGQRVRLQCTYA